MELLSISSEPKPANGTMTGEYVKLWPYLTGVYSRDILGRLWQMIEQHGDGPRLFWGNAAPLDVRMDLPAFCAFFSTDTRALLFITQPDGEAIIGCAWWEEIIPGHQAFGSIYLIPSYRGRAALEAINLGTQWAFDQFDLRQVWAVTPWPAAAALITRAGYERMATLPDFARVTDEVHDVGVFRKVRT